MSTARSDGVATRVSERVSPWLSEELRRKMDLVLKPRNRPDERHSQQGASHTKPFKEGGAVPPVRRREVVPLLAVPERTRQRWQQRRLLRVRAADALDPRWRVTRPYGDGSFLQLEAGVEDRAERSTPNGATLEECLVDDLVNALMGVPATDGAVLVQALPDGSASCGRHGRTASATGHGCVHAGRVRRRMFVLRGGRRAQRARGGAAAAAGGTSAGDGLFRRSGSEVGVDHDGAATVAGAATAGACCGGGASGFRGRYTARVWRRAAAGSVVRAAAPRWRQRRSGHPGGAATAVHSGLRTVAAYAASLGRRRPAGRCTRRVLGRGAHGRAAGASGVRFQFEFLGALVRAATRPGAGDTAGVERPDSHRRQVPRHPQLGGRCGRFGRGVARRGSRTRLCARLDRHLCGAPLGRSVASVAGSGVAGRRPAATIAHAEAAVPVRAQRCTVGRDGACGHRHAHRRLRRRRYGVRRTADRVFARGADKCLALCARGICRCATGVTGAAALLHGEPAVAGPLGERCVRAAVERGGCRVGRRDAPHQDARRPPDRDRGVGTRIRGALAHQFGAEPAGADQISAALSTAAEPAVAGAASGEHLARMASAEECNASWCGWLGAPSWRCRAAGRLHAP
eukprot:ctg_786.g164